MGDPGTSVPQYLLAITYPWSARQAPRADLFGPAGYWRLPCLFLAGLFFLVVRKDL